MRKLLVLFFLQFTAILASAQGERDSVPARARPGIMVSVYGISSSNYFDGGYSIDVFAEYGRFKFYGGGNLNYPSAQGMEPIDNTHIGANAGAMQYFNIGQRIGFYGKYEVDFFRAKFYKSGPPNARLSTDYSTFIIPSVSIGAGIKFLKMWEFNISYGIGLMHVTGNTDFGGNNFVNPVSFGLSVKF